MLIDDFYTEDDFIDNSDFDESEEPLCYLCDVCDGSGEGLRDGSTCPMCRGSGEIK